ncbi:protein jagged-1b-like [Ptychodera flava]|uniref:protein jagged-1b-like n=1 Tax=Ptychodera flava TaxID=63121 RepID=UPI003969CE2B
MKEVWCPKVSFRNPQFVLILTALIGIISCIHGNNALVRLRGGKTPFEGRVEVFMNEQWGTVCDVGWNINDADVVCKEAGFPGAMRPATLNPEKKARQKLMTDVECSGYEESIFQCEYKTEMTDCSNEDDAGVYCNFPGYKGCYDRRVCQKDKTNHPDMTIQMCLKHCRDNSMNYACLTGQNCECEINFPDDEFKFDNWSCDEACPGDETQACAGFNKSAVYETTLGECGRTDITDEEGWIVSHEFPGDYPGWDDCNWHVEVEPSKVINVTLRMLYLGAGGLYNDQVSFYNIDGRSENKVKLTQNSGIQGVMDFWVGLTTDNSLRVEFTTSRYYHDKGFAMFYKAFLPGECDINICQNSGTCYVEDGEKMCVCREGWKGPTCEESNNVCLSNPCVNNGTCGSISIGENDTFYCECSPGFAGYTCEHRITCENMTFCENNGVCRQENDTAFCECEPGYTGPFCENQASVRLADGKTPFEGRVGVFMNEQLGTVCDVGWDIKDAEVVCKEVGFPGAMRQATFNPETKTRQKLMTDVECSGNEESIFQCEYKTETTDCSNDDDAGVYCNFPGYKGCYDRGICQKEKMNHPDMTIQMCLNHCRGKKMNYACLTGQNCECEINIPDDELEFDNWSCDEACPGDETQACGGFNKIAVYETTLGECGRTGITDKEGWIVSPEFPGNYPGWDNCNWYVEAEPGEIINVTLRMLYLGEGGWIYNDQVSFYNIDGESGNKVKLTQSSGIRGEMDLLIGLTTGNSLRVEFSTSMNDHDKGFAVFYKAFKPGECDINICQNSGTCYVEDGEKVCVCTEGWKGPTCEESSNVCLSNPCINNGTCGSISYGEDDMFYCECPQGYAGYTCERRITCENMPPCENNGTCRQQNVHVFCECEPGFTGTLCETYIGTTKAILTTQAPVNMSTHTVGFSHQSSTTSKTGENYKDMARSNIGSILLQKDLLKIIEYLKWD